MGFDIEKMKEESKQNINIISEQIQKCDSMFYSDIQNLISSHHMTNDIADKIVDAVQSGRFNFISFDGGDMDVFIDNVKKYGREGLNMPC